MADIQVVSLNETTFLVTVNAKTQTTHEVTVSPEYAQQLSSGKLNTSELVKNSFVFLLAREPNTSILRRFDLSVIATYFPEYEEKLKK